MFLKPPSWRLWACLLQACIFNISHAESATPSNQQQIEQLKQQLAALERQNTAKPVTNDAAIPKFDMIRLPSGIAISKYEVTRQQFAAFVADTGYTAAADCLTKEKGEWGHHGPHNWQNPGLSQDNNHPVVCVSFNDAEAFIKWLNDKSGKHYRLPSQDEWYSACLGGSYNIEYCGVGGIDIIGWYSGNAGESTHSVGLRQPNAFGLHDMTGNVWEWTSTCYETDCSRRVARGGSWGNIANYARAEALNWNDITVRYDLLGFRLVDDRP